jgi:aspartyl-tRNA(Asn)/glutamyl-tRNA(Gln) amidotransferase subunit C
MSGPALDLEGARRIAQLSRLELTAEELARFAGQLDAVLRYVAQLEELELDGVEATSHADPRARPCPTRADELRPSSPREALLALAPAQDGEHFLVPRMIGHE